MDFIINLIKLMVSFVHDLTGGNQWLTTAIFAGLTIVLRRIPFQIYNLILRQLTVTLRAVDPSVESRSDTIDAILLYLRKYSDPRLQRTFMVNERARHMDERLISGLGNHWVKIADCRVVVNLVTNKNDQGETRTLILKTWFWNRAKLKNILTSVHPKQYDLPFIYEMGERYVSNVGIIPKLFGEQKQLIDKELYDQIDAIFNRFMNDDDFYQKRQKVRKETFLLYGPPGTGKTTLFRHLCSRYGIPIVLLTPQSLKLGLRQLISLDLGKVLILMDDVVISGPPIRVDDSATEVTAAKKRHNDLIRVLLNELDGIKPLNDIMIAMTTNHIEDIPKEVYRPGRVDHLIEFGYPSKETVMRAIGFDRDDDRYIYLNNLEVTDIPLDNIVSIRSAETLADVINIINARDNYLKLSLHANTTSETA